MDEDGDASVELRRNPSRKARTSLRNASQAPQLDDLDFSDQEQDEEPLQPSKKAKGRRARADASVSELDEEDSEEEAPAAKKPASKKARSEEKPGSKKSRGRVARSVADHDEVFLRKLPFDIQHMICQNLHPTDLLELSRTSKAMRALLLSPESDKLWHGCALNLPVELPNRPADLSWSAFVSLFFRAAGTPCMLCGTKGQTVKTSYHLRVRLCKNCESQNIILESELEQSIRDADELVFDYVHCDTQVSRVHNYRNRRAWLREEADDNARPRRFYLPELKHWHKLLVRDDDCLEERHHVMAQVRAEPGGNRDVIEDYTQALEDWRHESWLRHCREDNEQKKVFMEAARDRLLLEGMDNVTDEILSSLWKTSRQSVPSYWDRDGSSITVYGPAAPTAESVQREQALLAAQQDLDACYNDVWGAEERASERNDDAVQAIQTWLRNNRPDDEVIPSANTLVHISSFCQLVVNDSGKQSGISQVDIDAALATFASGLDSWTSRVLLQLCSWPLGSFKGDLDDREAVLEYLGRGSTVWKCTARNRSGKECGKLFGFPAVLMHGHVCALHGWRRADDCFELSNWSAALAEGCLIRRLLGVEGPFDPADAAGFTYADLQTVKFVLHDDLASLMDIESLVQRVFKDVKRHSAYHVPLMPALTVYTEEEQAAERRFCSDTIATAAIWYCSKQSCGIRDYRMTKQEAADHMQESHPRAWRSYLYRRDHHPAWARSLREDLGYLHRCWNSYADEKLLRSLMDDYRREHLSKRLGLTRKVKSEKEAEKLDSEEEQEKSDSEEE